MQLTMSDLLPKHGPFAGEVTSISAVAANIEPSAQVRRLDSQRSSRGTGRSKSRLRSNEGNEGSNQQTEARQLHSDGCRMFVEKKGLDGITTDPTEERVPFL